jgi:predicted small lipoprotein YifL
MGMFRLAHRLFQRQVRRERHDPGEGFGVAKARVQRDRAALGEPRQQDTCRWQALRELLVDESGEYPGRGTNSVLVGPVGEIRIRDVVPGAHDHAAVDRDRDARRVGKHVTHVTGHALAELGDDGLEVVTVGAEAMQPDDAGGGALRRLDDERFVVVHDGWLSCGWCAAAVYATGGPDQGPGAAILPDRREEAPVSIPHNRRSFLSAALAVAVSGIGTACGVKGPLYLPEETEEEKKKDEEKTSQREPANPASTLS